MNTFSIKIIDKNNIHTIIPLLLKLNDNTPICLLKVRLNEMITQDYECVGVYDDKKLIGIAGLWFTTRHYCGKSIEPDHVVIDELYRNKGIGKKLFTWIYKYAKSKGCEASELNTYVDNPQSHKFYYNEGYKILGFHFLKYL